MKRSTQIIRGKLDGTLLTFKFPVDPSVIEVAVSAKEPFVSTTIYGDGRLIIKEVPRGVLIRGTPLPNYDVIPLRDLGKKNFSQILRRGFSELTIVLNGVEDFKNHLYVTRDLSISKERIVPPQRRKR